MKSKFHVIGEDNRRYQADLAHSLFACLGCEAALEFCLSADWQGVLQHLLARCGLAGGSGKATRLE
jgi:hypothetical protein